MEEKKLYKVLDKELAEKYQVYPRYVLMECMVCGKTWGIRLDPGRVLTDRDCTCQACATEKYLATKEKE